jgi:PAS domain S-box-containing protein
MKLNEPDCMRLVNEFFAFENILYVGAQIGKGFREGYARILLDHMVDGIIIFDEFGKIQAFNPVAEKIFSYTADEVQMEPIDKLFPKLSPETKIQFIEIEKEKGERHGFGKEVTGVRKNGSPISLSLLVKKLDFNGCFLFMAIIRKE